MWKRPSATHKRFNDKWVLTPEPAFPRHRHSAGEFHLVDGDWERGDEVRASWAGHTTRRVVARGGRVGADTRNSHPTPPTAAGWDGRTRRMSAGLRSCKKL